MKIILSRKGFDSKYGGQPSPIFQDGTMLSLPIPQEDETIGYDELEFPFENEHWKNKKSYFNIISDLKAKPKISSEKQTAHLDPDLIQNVKAGRTEANWKAIFGQSSAAQSHLENHNIDKGDIFLFFGSFRETEFDNSTQKLKYKAGAPTIHAIWGYLVVDKKIEPSKTKGEIPVYAEGHPHAKEERKNEEGNCMYVAAEKVTINGEKFKGYGTFVFSKELHQLTSDGKSKSKWNLKSQLGKILKNKSTIISYHKKNTCIHNKNTNNEYFQSAAIGQEFVIDSFDTVEMNKYLFELLNSLKK